MKIISTQIAVFLQRVSIARCISYDRFRPSVRLSVRQSGIMSTQLKLPSWGLHCRIAP